MKKFLTLNPYTVAYREEGDGIPVLLLHGFLGSADTWEPLMAELSPHFRCLALDLLGFGESSKPPLRYTIWHQVEFLHQVIQGLNLQQFYLVGHSYGGWVAAAYGIAAAGIPWSPDKTQWLPTRIVSGFPAPAGLGLIAPAGIRDDSFVGRYNYMKPLLWKGPWVDWGIAALAPLAFLTRNGGAYRQVRRARRALKAQPVAKSFLVDRLQPEDAIDTVERFLIQISTPTLVFAGAQDTTIPLWHCETYARRLPNGELVVYPEATHDLPQEQAAAIAQALIAAWNREPKWC